MQSTTTTSSSTGQYLRLRPVPAAIQRVALYETRNWLYVVGSTNDGTKCRLLKIDRAPPSPGRPRLEVEDGGVVYSESEIKELLIMLDDGNKYSVNKYSSHGLQQVASAFGIVGFVRFLEGYYIVLITKRKVVATIGGHVIYKIEDTFIYPISHSHKPTHPEESKYLKVFQNIDLSSDFYFSYSYDLTLSLQCQMRTYPGPTPAPCWKFVWNEHLLKLFEGYVNQGWITHIVHGFVGQYNISVFGRPIYLTLIARRSKEYAGTRFLKRGANSHGDVANEVETEQIVHDASTCLHTNGQYTSYLQLRGSVPCFWSQDHFGYKPKPQITIDRASPFATPAAQHFLSCLKRCGSPVICLNLVKKREHRARESILTKELLTSIEYLNQFLPPEHHIQYIHKDMARINKSKTQNLIDMLEAIADKAVKDTGYFHSGPEHYSIQLRPNQDYKAVGGHGYQEGYIGRDQTGVLRVNCVDCLDRTNTAQFIAGKCALGYQLYTLGIISEPKLEFDCDTMRILEEVYEDLGDTLAIQYGGSHLVHRIQTYRKVSPVANHGRDLLKTIQRYYRNAFTDAEKQMAINIFLGIFEPQEGSTHIWDLNTDYLLHHSPSSSSLTHGLYQQHVHSNPTKWWTDRLLKSLPLPVHEVESDKAHEAISTLGSEKEEEENKVTGFHEIYRTFELTDFDNLFFRNIPRTGEHDPVDPSPFVVRTKPKWIHSQKQKLASRQAIVGSPSLNEPDQDSPTSMGSSSEEEDPANQNSDQLHSPGHAKESPLLSDLTCKEVYGFELHEASHSDSLLYARYSTMHRTANQSSFSPEAANWELAQWEPSYHYKGSTFEVDPPTVSQKDQAIYEESVQMARNGPPPLPTHSLELYTSYAKRLLI